MARPVSGAERKKRLNLTLEPKVVAMARNYLAAHKRKYDGSLSKLIA